MVNHPYISERLHTVRQQDMLRAAERSRLAAQADAPRRWALARLAPHRPASGLDPRADSVSSDTLLDALGVAAGHGSENAPRATALRAGVSRRHPRDSSRASIGC